MVTKITAETLASIKNEGLKKDALRYIDMYGDFIKAVEESGVKVHDLEDKAQNAALIEKLKKAGATVRNGGKSIVLGAISPSCEDCRTGFGSATYILTLACNRDCFFCTNKNQFDYEDGKHNINDVISGFKKDLKRYKEMKSAALTGGEPLLHPEKCAEFIRKVKKTSKNVQTRIYTNGDLATPEIFALLKDAGLDEIRFGLKPEEIDAADEKIIGTIREAVKYIPRVMVEMPVFPGTLEKMKTLMLALDEIGIFGVNILEFLYPWVHPEEYNKHGHEVAHRPYGILFNYTYAGGLPVSGSETECLELLLFCAEKKVKMGVHYCSLENKLTAQIYHHNFNLRRTGTEMFSEKDFFIKTAKGYGDDIAWIKEKLDEAGCEHYIFNNSSKFIEFSPEFVPLLKEKDIELALSYQVVDFDEEDRKVLREVQIDMINPRTFLPEEI